MPGAAQDFTHARETIVAGPLARLDQTGRAPVAQIAALMRTAVEQAEKFAAEIEDDDLAASHFGHQTLAGGKLRRWPDDMTRHQARP